MRASPSPRATIAVAASLAFTCALVGGSAPVLARPVAVEGIVVAAQSRWTADGSRIVTAATVRTADGRDVEVSQLGGSVDGLTMRTFPGPEILQLGMRVAVTGAERMDLAQRAHNAVESVRVLEYPPGFVRTGPTKAGRYLYWESGCVYIKASAEGTQHLPGTRELEIIEASAKTWNDGTASCSFMRLVVEKPEVQEVGRDNVNLIKFRDTSWCRPATGDDPMRCHSESAAGLTTATYVDDARSARDGAIVDADIEMNGVTFAIAEDGRTQGTAPCQSELQNTLTHELGHLLGLEHPCRTAGDPARVDNNGAPVPACGLVGNNPVITEATMYNFQDCGEQKKETLSPDDTAAVCAVYPKAEDPGACDRVGEADSGCCRVGRGSSGAPLQAIAGAIGLAALLARRRRQPRATSHPAPRG